MENQDAKNSQEKDSDTIDQLIRLGPSLTCSKDHYFVYQTGTEVRCTKCPIGYPVAPGTECRDGHLYIHGEKVL